MDRFITTSLTDFFIQILFVLLVGLSLFCIWFPKKIFGVWDRWKYWIRGFAVAVLACFCYAVFVEPRLITVATYQLPLVKEPKTWVRAILLTDAHAGFFKEPAFYRRVADRVRLLNPDVIFIGGDFVDGDAAALSSLESWRSFSAPLGVYAVLGNHDYYRTGSSSVVRDWIRSSGFKNMTNRSTRLSKEGRSFILLGLDDARLGTPDYSLFVRSATQTPRLLFTHDADALLRLDGTEVNGALIGHTHGGQVRLPIIGSLSYLPQQAPQWLDRGLKYWHQIPVVISQGIGETVAPIRFDCPPQIVEVNIGI